MTRLSNKTWKRTKGGRKNLGGNKGYVYILSNPSHKYLKIGLTQRAINKRIQELNSATGVVDGFILEYYVESNDCKELEKRMHEVFSNKRVNNKREFFSVSKRSAKKRLIKENNKISKREPFFNKTLLFLIFILIASVFYFYFESNINLFFKNIPNLIEKILDIRIF